VATAQTNCGTAYLQHGELLNCFYLQHGELKENGKRERQEELQLPTATT